MDSIMEPLRYDEQGSYLDLYDEGGRPVCRLTQITLRSTDAEIYNQLKTMYNQDDKREDVISAIKAFNTWCQSAVEPTDRNMYVFYINTAKALPKIITDHLETKSKDLEAQSKKDLVDQRRRMIKFLWEVILIDQGPDHRK